MCACALTAVMFGHPQRGGGEGRASTPLCPNAVRRHAVLDRLEYALHPLVPEADRGGTPRDPLQHLLAHGHSRLQPEETAHG